MNTASFANWGILTTLLISVVIPCHHQLHTLYTRSFADVHHQLRPQALDDVQAHYNQLYELGSDTGASFETMRELLSAAFPPTQLYYLLRLVEFVNEPFRSKAKRHIAVILTKRHLAIPPSSANFLLPPVHATRWKQRLGIWLKQWVADRKQLFPSLFLPKIRVIETRSATLGDRIFSYRGWQQRWTPDTHFRCSCFGVSSQHLLFAHSHAVILSHFESVFSEIDHDVMAASMKDQYYGSSEKLLAQLRQKVCRLACRLRLQTSTFLTDIQVILQEIIDEHHCNLISSSRWTSEMITPAVSILKTWVVTPADHFPSRAHVLCPALFSQLLHSTFCTHEVFVPCRQPLFPGSYAHHDTPTNPAPICLGTPTTSTIANSENSSQA